MTNLTVIGLLWLALIPLHATAANLKLERQGEPDARFSDAAGTTVVEGPMVIRALPITPPDPADRVLEFEYFCVGGMPAFSVLPGPPFEGIPPRTLPELGHRETWSRYSARLATPDNPLPEGWRELRLDLPLPAGRVLQIRNATVRPELPGEFEIRTAKPAASATEEALTEYLANPFPAAIQAVAIGSDEVRIAGNVGKLSGPLFLAEIPMDVVLNDPQSWQSLDDLLPASDGTFRVALPRIRQRDGLPYDRLTSRWQVVRSTATGYQPLSHARYAEEVPCRSPQLPAATLKNKKGLGGWSHGRLPNELTELGISAVTVNVMIHSLISLTPGPNTFPIHWQGRTYHANGNALAALDATFLEAQKHQVMVSAILLIPNPAKSSEPVVTLMGHPDAHREGIFAMPNVTSPEGIALYGAVLNLMAERWSRPDGKYGRVHHWILHNEVDAGWVWTNAGEKSAVSYLDLYQRSMRLMDLIARQYDPHSRPFISLTHFWAAAGDRRWYGSKRLLDLLADFTRAEGDFPWALAYHPYPQDLFNPRTWEDSEVNFTFESPLVTPKNLEVLDAYMKQPALLHHAKVRPVHLSENGFNSKSYSERQLADQAAGMALAWKKIQSLSSVESWQYHNWIDNRDEGGLKIGLRKFPDEATDPLGKKPIWHLYQALGTPQEEALAAPYLKTIGIRQWSEVLHQGTIR
jgi:hypothetical protein